MPYELLKTDRFKQELFDFLDYLAFYGKSQKLTQNIFDDINRDIENYILRDPYFSPYHHFFGPPFRGFLYKYSKQSTYWLVYTLDETTKTISLLSFWHAARDPESFL